MTILVYWFEVGTRVAVVSFLGKCSEQEDVVGKATTCRGQSFLLSYRKDSNYFHNEFIIISFEQRAGSSDKAAHFPDYYESAENSISAISRTLHAQ